MRTALQIGQVIRGQFSSYRISQLLEDKGTPNKVWLAIGANDERKYVVKTFSNSSLRNQRSAIEAFRGSPFIRQQVDEATNPTAVVFEYLDEDLLSLSSRRRLKIPEIKAIGKRILHAICSLHQSGYVHTDIKLNNVLINHEDEASQVTDIKLADCEAAALIKANNFIASGPIGAAIFRSPEAFFQRGVGPPTDIWSFGTMLISLLLGPKCHIFRPPPDTLDAEWDVAVLQRQDIFFGPFPTTFAGRTGDDITQLLLAIAVLPHERRPFRNWDPDEIAPADVDFVCKIMQLDPEERPSAKDLLQDEWFST